MIREVCLDANILVACLTPEPQQAACLRLMDYLYTEQIVLMAPALIVFEVSSSLQRKFLGREVTKKTYQQALNLFFELPLFLQWQDHLLKKAAEFARRLHFKNIYDTSYLALACNRGIPLITLDKELLRKGRSVCPDIETVQSFLVRSSHPR